jgi:hypothetical protein
MAEIAAISRLQHSCFYQCLSASICGLICFLSFLTRKNMRIKIIGENNCARATRHLLRLAGFAVTEFLPAEVVTLAPHLGFVITIESFSSRAVSTAQTPSMWAESTAHTGLAPAIQPLPAFAPITGATAGLPTSRPDSSPHDQPAVHGGAPPAVDGASSPAFFSETENAGSDVRAADEGGELSDGSILPGDAKRKQADGSHVLTTRACSTGNIHFDSVDGDLEAAILRHVTQLAAAPVVVDRPGGVVHSERELRIVLPVTGDARVDEAAAVAVEFGVLRGLLDLTQRPSRGELSAGAAEDDAEAAGKSGEGRGGRKKWWVLWAALLGIGLGIFGAGLDASPRVRDGATGAKGTQTEVYATRAQPFDHGRLGGSSVGFSLRGLVLRGAGLDASPRVRDGATDAKGTQTEVYATRAQPFDHGSSSVGFSLRGLVLRGAGRAALATAAMAAPARPFAPEPQGQFATGQAGGSSLDPCQALTKLYVSINQTANTQLVAGTSAKKIYVCSIHVVVAAATSVALVEGTGTVCATGTAGVSGFGGATAATGWNLMANGGIVLGSGAAAVGAEGTSADNLCLFNSGSGQVSGGISYVAQ